MLKWLTWKLVAGTLLLVAAGYAAFRGVWVIAAWGVAISWGVFLTDVLERDPRRMTAEWVMPMRIIWFVLMGIALLLLAADPSMMSRRAVR